MPLILYKVLGHATQVTAGGRCIHVRAMVRHSFLHTRRVGQIISPYFYEKDTCIRLFDTSVLAQQLSIEF